MIDSHCHINDPAYSSNPQRYIEEANASGVKIMLVVGYDVASSKTAAEIASNFPNIYAAVGIHPSEIKKMKKGDFEIIESLLSNSKVIALGEIGLDYYWDKDENVRELQQKMLIKQISIANKHNKPIVIHCRDAYEDCATILRNYHVKCGGIIHCYSGSVEMVDIFVKLGYLIGLGGTVTFKNSIKPKEVAAHLRDDQFVLETDAPYLAPMPHRGELNHSKFLPLIRDEIARIRHQNPLDVEKNTSANFMRVFHL